MDLFIVFNIIESVNEVSSDWSYFFISISIISQVIKGYFMFDIVSSDIHILWLYNITDRIYKYNPDASYKPNGGTYRQIMSAKDLYIQNITVAEHDGHSDSFQVKFFTNYPLGAVRVEDQRFKDWDHYKFTLWQTQLNFAVFCASSACGISVEHLNAKKPMIRSVYRFHVHYTSEGYLRYSRYHCYKRIVSISITIRITMRSS